VPSSVCTGSAGPVGSMRAAGWGVRCAAAAAPGAVAAGDPAAPCAAGDAAAVADVPLAAGFVDLDFAMLGRRPWRRPQQNHNSSLSPNY
jgi:hypothetical protein